MIDCNECRHFDALTWYCQGHDDYYGRDQQDACDLYEHVKDNVNHPSHYETGKFECIEVMTEALGRSTVESFCLCNAFKYLYRCSRKNGVEDVQKANWYLNKFLELVRGDENE